VHALEPATSTPALYFPAAQLVQPIVVVNAPCPDFVVEKEFATATYLSFPNVTPIQSKSAGVVRISHVIPSADVMAHFPIVVPPHDPAPELETAK